MNKQTGEQGDNPKTRRFFPARPALTLLLLLVLVPGATLAQRKNQVTGTIDVGGAIDDNPFVDRGGLAQISSRDFSTALTVFPTVGIVSSTAESRFTLDYSFGFEKYQSTVDLDSKSHRVSGRYEADLSPRWRLRLADSYTRSPDFSSFLAFRGLILTPQGILLDFAPTAIRRDGFQNSADLGFDWARSTESSLSFGIHHWYRQYDDLPGFNSYSDGQSYGARAEFRKKTSARQSWTVGYNVDEFRFDHFGAARNHDVLLGVEHQVNPSVSVRFKAGPSYAQALAEQEVSADPRKSFLGYNIDCGVTRSSASTAIGLFYRRDNGISSSIGSVSTAHTLGFDFSTKLGRRLTTKLTAMGYDYRGQFDNPFDNRGITSTLQFELILTRYSALSFGGSYYTQESAYLYSDLERRRLFFSLRFSLTDLFKRTVG